MTSIWPMQRLSLIIVALAVVGFQSALPEPSVAASKSGNVITFFCAAAILWSAFQGERLRALAHQRTVPADETRRVDGEENVNVSEYSYQQLPQRPAYFIHGVTDPRMELRLLDPSTGAVQVGNKAAVDAKSTAAWIELTLKKTPNPALFELSPTLRLLPGIRYLLTFDFVQPNIRGILRLSGSRMQRSYVLPSAGEAKGFGTGADQEKSITVWTSGADSEVVQLEYIRDDALGLPLRSSGFAKIRLTPIDPVALPAEATSFLPLTVTVRAPTSALLESMRVFIPGWTARVNGQSEPVLRSPQGLAAVAVPQGESRVEFVYRGPLLLRVAFWLSGGSALLLGLGAVISAFRLVFRKPIPVPDPAPAAN